MARPTPITLVMFGSNIVIADSTATDRTFKQVSADGSSSVRMDSSTSLLAPRKMLIRHSVSKPKGQDVAADSHNLQFSIVKIDSENEPQTATLNVTYRVPRSPVITTVDLANLWAFANNWLEVQANRDGFLIGEY